MSKTNTWPSTTIHSWSDFETAVSGLRNREWLFRGQASSDWGLSTSLNRLFQALQPIIKGAKGHPRQFAQAEHERLLVRTFQKNANLYLDFFPEKPETLEWLAIMQHYGTPTRLLDVTHSPYLALHFALQSATGDCCVFAVNHAEIKKQNLMNYNFLTHRAMNRHFFTSAAEIDDIEGDSIFSNDLELKTFITAFTPTHGNERWVVQQGLFLVPSQIHINFETLLRMYVEDSDSRICRRLTIASDLRFEAITRLRRMNITSATLFPGIAGFCDSLKFQVLETTGAQKSLD
jgi:hypothetical protein